MAQVAPSDGLADLHLDHSRSDLPNPLLFADCTLDGRIPIRTQAGQRLKTKLADSTSALCPKKANNTVLTRLVFPFVDVIAIFADDLGGLDAVLKYLEDWSTGEVAATTPWKARPRVVVITFELETSEAVQRKKAFNSQIRAVKHRRHFSAVRLTQCSPRSSAAARRSVLDDELRAAIGHRKSERVLFTAQHLSWFFSRAVAHVNDKPHEPLDFIAASRFLRPLDYRYTDQLRMFLRLAADHSIDDETVTQMIASSIVLDAYPPSAHGSFPHSITISGIANARVEFCPADVFSTIYEAAVRRALEAKDVRGLEGPDPVDPVRLLGRITAKFCKFVNESFAKEGSKDFNWAVQCRLRILKATHGYVRWDKVRSNICCLGCFGDCPQHVLSCTHSLCDSCVPRFGEPESTQEYRYAVWKCPICSTPSDLRVVLKPPTAGIRVLNIDGGGVRGVVPLKILELLQASMGQGGPIQDYFDIAFGVSAGTSSQRPTSS